MITSKVKCGAYKIYINDMLHLLILPDQLNGIYSWRQDNKFFIEYHMKKGNPIVTEYSEENWPIILGLLDELSTTNK
jgi:hypothetical protein